MKQQRRIMIAAPRSGSGKTTITCALLQTLKNQGEHVVSYKCGPDYIDPLFHQKIIGIPARNLDTFFTDGMQTRRLLADSLPQDGFAVIEGVMGLFDGLGGVRREGSSYHLAKVTGTPIVLVADVKGMGQSMIAMLAGFLNYDKEKLIRGVILNRISKKYFEMIKPLIEKTLGIAVLGFLLQQPGLHMGSRHLGLILPDELADIKEELQETSEELCRNVSLEAIAEIASGAEELNVSPGNFSGAQKHLPAEKRMSEQNIIYHKPPYTQRAVGKRPVIAVARDEAFCFYYAENIELLQRFGAEIVYFSPLHDKGLPKNCHGILLGGGYPELYARHLSENRGMHLAIKQLAAKKAPMVAECGGFLYLHETLCDEKGDKYHMAGVIPGECYYAGKSIRFGYIEVQGKQGYFLSGGSRIKGHEFHYYDSANNGEDALAIKPVTGKTYPCIMEGEAYWFGFPHLYYPSHPAFAESFVAMAQKYKEKEEGNGTFASFF